jgi:NitT/TauT family transport system permease protein
MSTKTKPQEIAAPLSLAAPARHRWGVLAAQLVVLTAFFLLWEWAARTKAIDPLFIGQPSKIAAYLVGAIGGEHSLIMDAGWTLGSTAVAFLIGSVGGLAFGLLFVAYPMIERFFDPLFSALNALPRIALAPLFLLWFGLGPASKIALGASLTFFIVLNSTIAGARSVDADWLTLSRMLGASKVAMFFKVTLISAVPTIFSGLRLGLIYALLGVIGGEIIAAQHGLGQQLTYLAGTFDTNGVFGVLLVLALIGVTLTWAMSAVENHLLRWR